MRSALVLVFLIGLSACSDDARQAAVVPLSIDVSNDRRTVTGGDELPTFRRVCEAARRFEGEG
jgi:hypothetical protein